MVHNNTNWYLISKLVFSFFIAGYDRKLPGFPRYTVLGTDESGEYSLKVSNATLEDDAVYECQVGPATNNKPIRASARLNVMRKFSKPCCNIIIINCVVNIYILSYTSFLISDVWW